MKTIALFILNLILFLIAQTLLAQTPPPPPDVTTSSTSHTYSETSSDADGRNQNTNVSVSISNSDDSYSFRAKYPESKYEEIKVVLDTEMSRNNLSNSKGKLIWVLDSDDEEVYKVVLSNTKLSMVLDKDIASSSLVKKFESLGKILRTIIAGSQNDNKRDADRIQRDADRIRREAEQMRREADRMVREAKRMEKGTSSRYEEDARRIADEARRMADEAAHLGAEAAHRGSVSDEIKSLLREARTTFNNDMKSSGNWHWPDAQRQLVASLVADGLISDKGDINFNKDHSGTYVNGKKLSATKEDIYEDILTDNGISKSCEFRWYRTGQHIIVVNSNADLEGFIADGVKKGLLSSAGKKVKLQINGNSIVKDGAKLSASELSDFNKLLLQNNIIPAPGKIFEIMRTGAFKVGYSLGEKAHLGTWSIQN